MKIRLSEWIDDREREPNVTPAPDEAALERVRKRALEKAGFEQEPAHQGRIGRRALIVPAAALVALMLFATALGATGLGVRIADLFREMGGARSALNALELYGSAAGQEVTQNGITLRIEAAYADAGENLLAVSFQDEQGRLGEGMYFVPELRCDEARIVDMSWYSPAQASDGTMHAPLIFQSDKALGGKDVKLSVERIVPSEELTQMHATGITLGEALEKNLPFPVPGVPEVQFVDIHVEESGLIISLEYLDGNRFYFNDVELRQADGAVLEHNAMGASYESYEEKAVVRPVYGFRQVADAEAFKDCELLVSYTRQAPPVEGEWTLTLRMPHEAGGSTADVPIHRTVQLSGGEYELATAWLYPSCVVLDYSYTDTQTPEREVPEGTHWLFETQTVAMPAFRLLDVNGQQIGFDLGSYDSQSGDALRYKAVIQCLTQQQESIVLEVRDARSQEVLLTQKLK